MRLLGWQMISSKTNKAESCDQSIGLTMQPLDKNNLRENWSWVRLQQCMPFFLPSFGHKCELTPQKATYLTQKQIPKVVWRESQQWTSNNFFETFKNFNDSLRCDKSSNNLLQLISLIMILIWISIIAHSNWEIHPHIFTQFSCKNPNMTTSQSPISISHLARI